jgi:hypothetical protein
MGLLAATIASRHIPTGGGGGDPYWTSVVVLINNEGANASQPSPAVVGGVITYRGTAALSTTSPPTGQTSSLSLAGGASPNISSIWVPSGTSTSLPGDFTMEFWIKPSANPNNARVIACGQNSDGTHMLLDGSTAAMTCALNNAGVSISGGYFALGSVPTTGFTYLSVARTGTTVAVRSNGVLKGTFTSSATFGGTNNGVTFGSYLKGDSNGFMGNYGPIRITKGVYRDCSVTPTLPLPES